MTDISAWISVVIPIGSLVVAILAFITSHRTQNQANRTQSQLVEIQSKLVAIEEQEQIEAKEQVKMAELRAGIGKSGKSSYKLWIRNNGQAEAHNVTVWLGGKPLKEHCAHVSRSDIPERIGPDSEVSCLLGLSKECFPPFDFKVTWDDDFGNNRSYGTTLTC